MALRVFAAGVLDVFFDERAQLFGFRRILDALDVHHLRVDARGELVVLVEHIGDAARHARGEVAARGAEHHDAAAGHVFAAMVAHGLDDGVHAGVAHGEAFARHAAHEHLALGRAVQRDVADDHVLLGRERGLRRREHGELAARQSLAEVVVGVALEREAHAVRHERAEALARRTLELDLDGVLGQARRRPTSS